LIVNLPFYLMTKCLEISAEVLTVSKCLFSTDCIGFLDLYRSSSWSKLDYGCYGSSRQCYIRLFDTIHHQGLRFSCGRIQLISHTHITFISYLILPVLDMYIFCWSLHVNFISVTNCYNVKCSLYQYMSMCVYHVNNGDARQPKLYNLCLILLSVLFMTNKCPFGAFSTSPVEYIEANEPSFSNRHNKLALQYLSESCLRSCR